MSLPVRVEREEWSVELFPLFLISTLNSQLSTLSL